MNQIEVWLKIKCGSYFQACLPCLHCRHFGISTRLVPIITDMIFVSYTDYSSITENGKFGLMDRDGHQ